MHGLLSSLLAAGLAFGEPEVGAPEDGKRFAPPPVEHGFDLREGWDDIWRRFEDRHGRPDPRGPLLQPSPELQGAEYELTLAVASQPMYLDRDWALRTRGGRVFIHSDDEFSFFNGVHVKERVPMGRAAALGLRYDRTQVREIDSSLFQLAFAFPDIRGTGLFVEIRPIARFEKPDLDVEFAFGWAERERGKVQARVFVLDPFNNATDALAQNRDRPQELRVIQRNPSFGLALEGEVSLAPTARAQLYAGAVMPSRSSYYYLDDDLGADALREQWAMLGGASLEWGLPRTPLWLGASATHVTAYQDDHNDDGAFLTSVPEHETRARAYLLAHLDDEIVSGFLGRLDLELAGSYRLTQLPTHAVFLADLLRSIPRDRSWMAMARAQWLPTRVFGLELGYLVIDRQAEGDALLVDVLSGVNHRLSTRFALAWAPHVWITFGVGWDLDDPSNRYDQGGMSLTARW